MSLESLGSFFESKRPKNTLQKAQLAYALTTGVKAIVHQDVKVILRKSGVVVVECPDEACAAKLNLHYRQLNQTISRILGAPPTKLRITTARES